MSFDISKTVFIVDGSSFLYRAYYSMRPLHTKAGVPVQAVYSFCRMMKKMINDHSPQALALVWDSQGKTARHEEFVGYKQTRQAPPADIFDQKKYIQQFAEMVGIRQVQAPGIEADDLMYSLAQELVLEGQQVVLVTSDKDLGQMLGEQVMMLDPFKESFITKEILELKYGFELAKLPFYFALIGDSSDNIPGVKGIGPKGAQELVKKYSSLDELYANLDQISSERTKNLLTSSKADAYLSERLFRLRFYPTCLTRTGCLFDKEKWANADPLFQELNFTSLLTQKTQQEMVPLSTRGAYTFVLVNTPELLQELCLKIQEVRACAVDTEVSGLNPLQDTMLGVSLCIQEGVSYYVPCGHTTGEQQLSPDQVVSALKPLFEDETIEKYLHHAKFDALVLYHAGIELRGISFDTMIAASLLVGEGQRVGLKFLSEYYLQEQMASFQEIVKGSGCENFSQVPLARATEYAASDAHQTFKLKQLFSASLEKEGLSNLFYQLEMPLMKVLIIMEKAGIFLDRNVLAAIDNEVSQQLFLVKQEILNLIGFAYAGINLNSPKQLEELLFVNLQLPVFKKTGQKTGYSTDQEVLRDLAKIHPVPGLIMRYRELFKLKSTYLDALGTYINPLTGRIHTTFSQTAVATGRLASSDPNLQNIPVDSYHIRSAFKANPGCLFLSADYSQIELRVLAHLSQDATLLQAFREGQDIHKITAAGLFDIPLDCVTSEQRQLGKRINFSILYGLTPYGLSKDLDISHATAKLYIDKYMARYPGVSAWMEKVVAFAYEKGYVCTEDGRRRYLSGIYEKNRSLYELARRMAINTVAQGTAAEIMKKGMVNLQHFFIRQGLASRILLQIHDELLIEVPEVEKELVGQLVKDTLEQVVSWDIPLEVTICWGFDWQQITK